MLEDPQNGLREARARPEADDLALYLIKLKADTVQSKEQIHAHFRQRFTGASGASGADGSSASEGGGGGQTADGNSEYARLCRFAVMPVTSAAERAKFDQEWRGFVQEDGRSFVNFDAFTLSWNQSVQHVEEGKGGNLMAVCGNTATASPPFPSCTSRTDWFHQSAKVSKSTQKPAVLSDKPLRHSLSNFAGSGAVVSGMAAICTPCKFRVSVGGLSSTPMFVLRATLVFVSGYLMVVRPQQQVRHFAAARRAKGATASERAACLHSNELWSSPRAFGLGCTRCCYVLCCTAGLLWGGFFRSVQLLDANR